MLVSNENKYVFLSNEIAKHPELQQWTPEELFAKESDFDFWDELSEHLDCLRICDACNRPMIEGYCIDDAVHFAVGFSPAVRPFTANG